MLTFSADGALLASGGSDLAVLLWDLHDRARPSRIGPPLTGNTGIYVWAAAFTPDGRTLATGSDANVVLWDLDNPQRPQPLGLPLTVEFVMDLAFSPNGGRLAVGVGAQDPSVSLWDLTDRAQPRRLGGPLDRASAPVSFSADGHTLFTGGRDNAAGVFDLVPLDELRADPLRAACAASAPHSPKKPGPFARLTSNTETPAPVDDPPVDRRG
jgi:WD40 repeat protein